MEKMYTNQNPRFMLVLNYSPVDHTKKTTKKHPRQPFFLAFRHKALLGTRPQASIVAELYVNVQWITKKKKNTSH
jgi:hypothetical protein